MSLAIGKYIRKPFEVEAVQVTLENMEEVAQWCGGEVVIEEHDRSGGKVLSSYIKVDVNRPLNERQTKAYVNDWVLKTGNSKKCFGKTAFPRQFDPVLEEPTEQNLWPAQETLFHPIVNG